MAALATSLALPRWSTQVMRFRRPLRGAAMLGFEDPLASALAVFLVFDGKLVPPSCTRSLAPSALGGGLGAHGPTLVRDACRTVWETTDRMFRTRGESSGLRPALSYAANDG